MINPAGKGWGIHLLIFSHTATQLKGAGWVLLSAVLAPSLSSWPCSEPCKSENPGWERVRGAETRGQHLRQARNQAHEFHQHFSISKCILPPQGILGKDIFPALIFVRHRSHCVGAFLTYRNKSAQERPSDFSLTAEVFLTTVCVKNNQHEK